VYELCRNASHPSTSCYAYKRPHPRRYSPLQYRSPTSRYFPTRYCTLCLQASPTPAPMCAPSPRYHCYVSPPLKQTPTLVSQHRSTLLCPVTQPPVGTEVRLTPLRAGASCACAHRRNTGRSRRRSSARPGSGRGSSSCPPAPCPARRPGSAGGSSCGPERTRC
jgi:hypothetical protein